ncbi:tetratricopeptide repeat protein, partial [Candidatus Peregrinibacteria bacterium]|nr:tetratricopeptide repeat protein [Candidatus Peregrinibacteria bacterium]
MKYLSYLIWIVLIIALGAIMLLFEVPPFNPGGPLLPAENTLKLSPDETKNIDPEIKIERAKTYEEYINRGTMLEEKGYLTLALSEYEAAAEQNPDKILPLIKMSEIHLQTEDLVQAKVYADLANEINSENIAAKTMLGRVLIADRKLNDAKAVFDSIKSHNQTSRYYQAMLTSYIGDHSNAKGLFKDAINMGGSSEISSNAQRFIAAYNEFDSNQGGAPVHLNVLLSRAYVYAGEYQIAISLLFEALQEKKNYRDAWILLGYSYLEVGKFGEAVDALEEAIKLDSEKPQSYFYLGLAYYGLNNLPDAAANLEMARKKKYEPKA